MQNLINKNEIATIIIISFFLIFRVLKKFYYKIVVKDESSIAIKTIINKFKHLFYNVVKVNDFNKYKNNRRKTNS